MFQRLWIGAVVSLMVTLSPGVETARAQTADSAAKHSNWTQALAHTVLRMHNPQYNGKGQFQIEGGKVLAAGQEVILHGKPKDYKGMIVIDHPDFEVIRDDAGPSIHLERIVPVYRNISGINQRRLREIQYQVLEVVDAGSLDPVFDVDPSYPRSEAYRELHFPEAVEQAAARAER